MTLQNRLNKSDDQFESFNQLTERKILAEYRTSLNAILAKFDKLFQKNDLPSNNNVKRSEVLKLQKDFTDEINALNGVVSSILGVAILDSAKNAYSSTTKAFENTLKADWKFPSFTKDAETFVLQDNLWLDSVRNNNSGLLLNTKRQLDELLATNARQDIVKGLRQGMSYRKVAKNLREKFAISVSRSNTITFTEMHKGFSYGRNLGIEKAIASGKRLGIKMNKVWKHNGVGKPRPSHVAADGQIADPETGLFFVDGVNFEAPGRSGIAEIDINCHCTAQAEIVQS